MISMNAWKFGVELSILAESIGQDTFDQLHSQFLLSLKSDKYCTHFNAGKENISERQLFGTNDIVKNL
jgi:hypothetical protein